MDQPTALNLLLKKVKSQKAEEKRPLKEEPKASETGTMSQSEALSNLGMSMRQIQSAKMSERELSHTLHKIETRQKTLVQEHFKKQKTNQEGALKLTQDLNRKGMGLLGLQSSSKLVMSKQVVMQEAFQKKLREVARTMVKEAKQE